MRYIYAQDYLDRHPDVIGFSMMNCSACNFIKPNYLGGYVAFNPGQGPDAPANTLIVFGWSKSPHPVPYDPSPLWNEVGTGRCFGEGYKALFNSQPTPEWGMVLLGDGSLKADSHHWEGGGVPPYSWNNEDNWESDRRPLWDDHVRIGAAAVNPVQVDVGQYADPQPIWSIALRGGAGLEFPYLPPFGAGLRLGGSLFAEPVVPKSTITMHPQTSLQLPAVVAYLRNVAVVMEEGLPGAPTTLEVGAVIENCSGVEVGANCDVTTDRIEQSGFALVEGNVSADTIDDSQFTVEQTGFVNAEDIMGESVFNVGTNGDVQADRIEDCVFVLGQNAQVTADEWIFSSEFSVGQDASVTSATISGSEFDPVEGFVNVDTTIGNCRFRINPGGRVTAAGGITGCGPPEEEQWEITQGTVLAGGTSTLWGNWTISGVAPAEEWSASFEQLSANQEHGISMTLQDGAQVAIAQLPYESPTFPGVYGLWEPEHELVYGAGANEFGGGGGMVPPWEVMQFGDYTRIKGLDGASELNLDLNCELYIESDFRNSFVYQGWNTLGVDITAEPIWADESDPHTWWQDIELISPNLAKVFKGQPVIFLDTPCDGAFRDLNIVPLEERPDPLGDRYLGETWAAHWWDNSVIDASPAPWQPRQRDCSGLPEAGFFRNVTVGAYRHLVFAEVNGVIYYYGTRNIDRDAQIWYWYLDGETPTLMQVFETGSPYKWDDLMKRAEATIYGDWNGDCAISNAELADLQRAIAGGSRTYNALMDCDCDGTLTTLVELPKLLANIQQQPPCGGRGGDGGGRGGDPAAGGEAEGDGGAAADETEADGGAADDGAADDPWESYEYYDDVPGLAAWLVEVLPADELAAFADGLAVTVVEFADTPLGEDLAELLCYLE